jgi:glycine betaine/proline transport system ATP-binding protein
VRRAERSDPGNTVPAIEASGLTKIFGTRPKRGVSLLREGADREQLRGEGLTAAVIDASF